MDIPAFLAQMNRVGVAPSIMESAFRNMSAHVRSHGRLPPRPPRLSQRPRHPVSFSDDEHTEPLADRMPPVRNDQGDAKDDEATCAICMETIQDACTIGRQKEDDEDDAEPCTHRFCRPCLTQWWKHKPRGKRTCPTCRRVSMETAPLPDYRYQVQCRYHCRAQDRGCTFQGTLNQTSRHQIQCPHATVVCDACGDRVLDTPRARTRHVERRCVALKSQEPEATSQSISVAIISPARVTGPDLERVIDRLMGGSSPRRSRD